MKVIKKSMTPAGVPIQLEDWTDGLGAGLTIGAYPIAAISEPNGYCKQGETMRLTISGSKMSPITMAFFFENLQTGSINLDDLSPWFWNGEKDIAYTGLNHPGAASQSKLVEAFCG